MSFFFFINWFDKVWVRGLYLDHNVIEHHASRGCVGDNSLLEGFVFGESINGERFRPYVYELNAVLNVFKLYKDQQVVKRKRHSNNGQFFQRQRETKCLFLTVIIGSNGPNISSVMISASRGGSKRIVGSMNLKIFVEQKQLTYIYKKSKFFLFKATYKPSSSSDPPCTIESLTSGSLRRFCNLSKWCLFTIRAKLLDSFGFSPKNLLRIFLSISI